MVENCKTWRSFGSEKTRECVAPTVCMHIPSLLPSLACGIPEFHVPFITGSSACHPVLRPTDPKRTVPSAERTGSVAEMASTTSQSRGSLTAANCSINRTQARPSSPSSFLPFLLRDAVAAAASHFQSGHRRIQFSHRYRRRRRLASSKCCSYCLSRARRWNEPTNGAFEAKGFRVIVVVVVSLSSSLRCLRYFFPSPSVCLVARWMHQFSPGRTCAARAAL